MKLGVNIDHVATLRQQRHEKSPDPMQAGLVAQAHGADSIVVHLREDRRHIQDHDVETLRQALKIPLSLEMAATPEMERIAIGLQVPRVCLVPEKRKELTTEGGLNVVARRVALTHIVSRLRSHKIEVSLFVDAEKDQIRCAKALEANAVELHTGRYASAEPGPKQQEELRALQKASDLAVKQGLHLHAGHGLTYRNVLPVAAIPGMEELNIGFSIVSEAIFAGLGPAVQRMKLMITSRRHP